MEGMLKDPGFVAAFQKATAEAPERQPFVVEFDYNGSHYKVGVPDAFHSQYNSQEKP